MKIRVQSVHFDADVKLIQFIESKVSKLSQVSDRILNADIILKVEKSDDTQNKLVEVKLAIPGNDLFAKKHAKTFEEAIDLAVEALRIQLKKSIEKQREN